MPLVFNRRKGQRLYIGDQILIEVVETHRSSVSLRVTAPADVTILRAELANTTPAPPAPPKPPPEVLKARKRS